MHYTVGMCLAANDNIVPTLLCEKWQITSQSCQRVLKNENKPGDWIIKQ